MLLPPPASGFPAELAGQRVLAPGTARHRGRGRGIAPGPFPPYREATALSHPTENSLWDVSEYI